MRASPITTSELLREGASAAAARSIVASRRHRAFVTAMFSTRETLRANQDPTRAVTRFLRAFLRAPKAARDGLIAYAAIERDATAERSGGAA